MARADGILEAVLRNVEGVIVGKRDEVELALIALACQGHLLIEDVPGVGKTVLAKSLARSIGCQFKRIQFTPDLLPSDVTGASIYNQKTGEFEYRPGPVIAQVVLADEINRATPKTQASLLEAMEERQVTVDGTTYEMPRPFMVLATQNPIEYEGTFPLPEAQLDRFMLRLKLGYPSRDDEVIVLDRQQYSHPVETLEQVVSADDLMAAQAEVRQVHISAELRQYIVDLSTATRRHADVYLGASPRGSLALFRAAQARALLRGRDYAIPDDVKALAESALAHRLIVNPSARVRGVGASEILAEILRAAPVPGNPDPRLSAGMVRLGAFLALWLFIFITALAGGWSIMFKISYLLLLLFVVAWLWTRAGVWWLDVRREPLTVRGQVGSTMEERVVLRNLRWLPKPWLEIDAASTMPEHQTHVAASLGPHEERAWSLTACQRRGRYLLGPTTVTAGDPFGIFQRQRVFDSDVAVVVYPATLDVPGFRPLEGELPGGGQRRERVPYSTPMVTGIRDYQPGDPYNRIHWPNSARTGRLLVKEFEQDPVSDVWLVLDLDRNTHLGSGPGSTEEDAVTIAASMAKHFLLQNRAVGLVSQGHALQPDRGTRQLVRSLELLAVVRVRDFMPLGDLLVGNMARFGRGSAALLVTPTVREDWLGACQDLRLRGVRSAVILLEASTYGSTRPSTPLLGALAAIGVPTYVVRQGQPLAEALAQESGGMALPGEG